mmetsp:Transcript_110702/g.264010  ORF Transcript_110702/g.264010 Transcript_110702/m.264010 type:complete len:252 (-) Transcript_110702:488-1243(-)
MDSRGAELGETSEQLPRSRGALFPPQGGLCCGHDDYVGERWHRCGGQAEVTSIGTRVQGVDARIPVGLGEGGFALRGRVRSLVGSRLGGEFERAPHCPGACRCCLSEGTTTAVQTGKFREHDRHWSDLRLGGPLCGSGSSTPSTQAMQETFRDPLCLGGGPAFGGCHGGGRGRGGCRPRCCGPARCRGSRRADVCCALGDVGSGGLDVHWRSPEVRRGCGPGVRHPAVTGGCAGIASRQSPGREVLAGLRH